MTRPALSPASDLQALRGYDTPTICNALELVAPERRGFGYTSEWFLCARPELEPIVGYARTVTIRARHPGPRGSDEARAFRLAYLRYVAEGPKPCIIVVQDLDGHLAGYGSFWGEVHSTMHQALGAVGAITDGAMRDCPASRPASRSSHARLSPLMPMTIWSISGAK